MNTKASKYQDSIANRGWRIPSTDHKHIENNYYALVAMIFFVAFLFYAFKTGELWTVYGLLGSYLVTLLSLFIKARFKRKNWQVIEAECIDQEINKVFAEGGATWEFRILCKYEYNGESYTEPPFFWRTFASEESAKHFLNSIIVKKKCELRINPKKPIQVELKANDLKDFLLH